MPLSKEADRERKRKRKYKRGDRPTLFAQSYPHWEEAKHNLTSRERTIVEGFYLHCWTDREISLYLGGGTTRQNIAKQRLAALEKIKSLQ
jgi:hypothetical protein